MSLLFIIFQSRENVRVMACVGQVLSVLPYSDIIEQLNPILSPHIAELEDLTKQAVSQMFCLFTVKSFLLPGHLILCISWVGQCTY